MKIHLEPWEKATIVTTWIGILCFFSGIIVVAEYRSIKISEDQLKGTAVNVQGSLTAKETTFSLSIPVLGDGEPRILGPFTEEFTILEGQILESRVIRDTVSFPPLFPSRSWIEIYIDGELVTSRETHIHLKVAQGMWILTFLCLVQAPVRRIMKQRGWFKDNPPKVESVLKIDQR